jgi:hypothetical protein
MPKLKMVDELIEPTIEAKQAFALAFERIGGVAGLEKWARTHRSAFYASYTKLIPLQLNANATVDVTVHNGEEARQKLHDAFMRILASRREDKARGLELSADGAGPSPLEQVTYTRVDNDAAGDAAPTTRGGGPSTVGARPATADESPAPRADENQNQNHPRTKGSLLDGGPSVDRKTYPQPISAEPNTTSLFYDYYNGGGAGRMRWGPIGGGGPP